MLDQMQLGLLKNAVDRIRNEPPANLLEEARRMAGNRGVSFAVNEKELADYFASHATDDALLNDLGLAIARWDKADATEDTWVGGTEPHTPQRRALIYERLGFRNECATVLSQLRPIYRAGTIVVTDTWERWYKPGKEFYWTQYKNYLSHTRKWPAANVTSLDDASTLVVERLANPCRAEAYQAKGLVVGHVQSGKTANFTGVVAKAIDAGYRMIIVLSGTTNMLRAQTQRRIDMELIGKANILRDVSEEEARAHGVDYQDDAQWGAFNDFELEGEAIKIIRLTGHKNDYLGQPNVLNIKPDLESRPLFHPDVLLRQSARVAVIKKNAARLKRLIKDVRANRGAFLETPVLIIDDESDQASINTKQPTSSEITERTAINQCLAQLLELMPRAQYVGYTATPFANVFVDVNDEKDIFPKDFLISLAEPPAYMGAKSFHDIGLEEPGTNMFALTNQEAYVRDLYASTDDAAARRVELARAVDYFVLAGAIKLYRQEINPDLEVMYRHHTMMVHEAPYLRTHHETTDMIRSLFRNQYEGLLQDDVEKSEDEISRLVDFYETDFMVVSEDRLEEGVPQLPPVSVLTPFLRKALLKIRGTASPVLMVNSDRDLEGGQLNFDREPTWKILVGGTKLSRGFTVEGLTVSYFRRSSQMQDTLYQMGRWFGFRHGYRDLVRLFIHRGSGRGRKDDIYSAFEAALYGEESFRSQLAQYQLWDGDRPAITPIQVPPLVMQHVPWLKPTSSNKMWNAKITSQLDREFATRGYSLNEDDLEHNWHLVTQMLVSAKSEFQIDAPARGNGRPAGFRAFVGLSDARETLDMVRGLRWLRADEGDDSFFSIYMEPKLAAWDGTVKSGGLVDFMWVWPQVESSFGGVEVSGLGARTLVERQFLNEYTGRFSEVSDPNHRRAVESFVHGKPSGSLEQFKLEKRGVVVAYLMTSDVLYESRSRPVLGFRLYLPTGIETNDLPITWSVKSEERVAVIEQGSA